MTKRRCSTGFTAASLYRSESVCLAGLYLEEGCWARVSARVASEGLVQFRTLRSTRRICQELIGRLRRLTGSELAFLVETSPQEQAALLWIAVCRTYGLVAEFAIEVIRDHLQSLRMALTQSDFDRFFYMRSQWEPDLERISPLTRQKARQTVFRMLREAGFLSVTGDIISLVLSREFIERVDKLNILSIQVLPVQELELKGIVEWDKAWLKGLCRQDFNICSM